jgi:hypothetical protein
MSDDDLKDADATPDGSADDELSAEEEIPAEDAPAATSELVQLGDGQQVGDLARQLLDIAEAFGLHPHTVDYQPRAGGFVVPVQVAAAYAETVVETGDFGPVEPPKGARQVRKATVKKAAKRAAKKAAKPAEEGGPQ